MNDKEYTATANLGAVEIPENMKQYMVELLKLQRKATPQKPIALTNVYPSGQYECQCGCGLRANKKWQDKYCPNCGQAIDWSDFNEQMA